MAESVDAPETGEVVVVEGGVGGALLPGLGRLIVAVSVDGGEGRLTGCYRNLSGDPYIL